MAVALISPTGVSVKLPDLLDYDFETGQLVWKPRPLELFVTERQFKIWNTRYARKAAFVAQHSGGYRQGAIFNKIYKAHRVIWAIIHGEWPEAEVDHINGVRTDNCLDNLRAASRSENMRNTARSRNNTSGATGVRWRKDVGKWEARIKIGGRDIHIGLFADFDGAVAARKTTEAEHGFHANHGREPIASATS